MLLALKLDNVALIDALDLEFSPGLTVLTGETGAGKSLLLDSLDVLLGAEVPRHLLRHGQDQARIEGRFAPHGEASLLLEQRGLGALGQPPSALVVTRRLFRRGGRISSRGRINGASINRRTLLELRPLLIDLTVQGQTQRLGRPSMKHGFAIALPWTASRRNGRPFNRFGRRMSGCSWICARRRWRTPGSWWP